MQRIQGSQVFKVGVDRYVWRFPLPRPHTGILMGNGVLGAMVWGEGPLLRISLNRADYWDHRGGLPWTEDVRYADLRRSLEAGDEADLRRRFEATDHGPGMPERPSRLPLGRIEIDFGEGAELRSGTLDLADGSVTLHIERGDRRETIRIAMAMDRPGLIVHSSEPSLLAATGCVTASDLLATEFAAISLPPAERFDTRPLSGWVQSHPADPPICVGFHTRGAETAVAVTYGKEPEAARKAAGDLVGALLVQGFAALNQETAQWWESYWADVPSLEIPNHNLEFLFRYGMYKFAGCTQPGGVACTLQGPWVEEHRFPPWQSDYHFNINVQECYWPAYRGNRLSHLRPLFDMVLSWEGTLRENARLFLGIEDGLMLPHAVDDRCTAMGGFWSGAVDHGCTAWVAHMMAQYVRYSGDIEFLREKAYPFMQGAMRVYEAMLEREGDAWVLPVSVSPEYRGNRLDAWGRNASFQLACIHALVDALLEAASLLNVSPKPIWHDIQQGLPKACVMGDPPEIYLWEGTPLEESHRHHSHLAGMYPFDVVDVDDPQWSPIVARSARRWIAEGSGLWSGWCMPWAAILHTALGHADAAEVTLETWHRIFTNEGQGTLHDANVPGISLIGSRPMSTPNRSHEKMQLDAGLGAVGAVMELLLQTRRGVHYLFPGAPGHWDRVAFAGIRTEGAFLVSAERVAGKVTSVRVVSEQGGEFRLADPWHLGTVRTWRLAPGETLTVTDVD